MNSSQYREYQSRQDRELDRALARVMALVTGKAHERIATDELDRFITMGVVRHGSRFKGFAHGIAAGKIRSNGLTDAGRLYRLCYVGTYGNDAQALDYLLGDLGVLEQLESIKADTAEPLRELLTIDEDSAWTLLEQRYYVARDEYGIHAYRRSPLTTTTE